VKVRVKLFSDLRDKYAAGRSDGIVEIVLKEGSAIRDVFETIQIHDGEVGFVLLNEDKVQKEAHLSDGDLVQIFSFVDGG
jgi:molybdopterin converting factor small subunit